MNIYELATKKFTEFKGEKLTVWESGQSKVWMEVNSSFDVYVYAMKNGVVLSGRWMIGSLLYDNGVYSYKLNSEYKLKTDYQTWVKQVSA